MFRSIRRAMISACLLAAGVAQANVPPAGVAKPASGNVVVVLNSRDATVQLLDQSSYKSLQTFAVGKEPHHLMATPDNKSLIVASSAGNELVFLDPKSGQVQRHIKDILDPYQIGFTPDQKWFVATSLRLDRVDLYKFDGKDFTLSRRLPMPKLPSHIAFDAHSKMAFITQQGSDQVSAIDLATQTIKWTIPVGKLPAGITMTPDDKYLLVGIMGSDYVEVIDWRTQKTVKRIKAGAGTHNFRAQGDNRYTYVSNRVSNSINIIDQKTLENVGQINVPGGPDCMEITADGKTMWVTLRWIKKVAVIDLASRKVVKYIPVGRSPHGVFFANSSARM
ncbi:cytochrome D1 domain-containing protein [Pseudoduganella plicata]|uniref:YncE family protein n=1 Tax=Pseudoduganella plicata TaxID=321984 RepID=A0A4P7BJS7_9BURK|nr:cytochrome D1 domain-containing protein [Pseudoduganella plicata]QBQ38522.1 YncE family protein [Pseudoduganella plicata]GGY82737.1 hypothetical protein GCM10007388_14630 [Pseudoduganella plicata]